MRHLTIRRAPILFAAVGALALAGSVSPVAATHEPADAKGMDIVHHSQNTTDATNSDLAFWGDLAFAGNYDGFRIFDTSTDPPDLVADVACKGNQGDMSVWDRDGDGEADILFHSVDEVMETDACGALPQNPPQGPTTRTTGRG